jgi:D-glycero-D-manno-heptose 1,7-bisphosphate phosphatase
MTSKDLPMKLIILDRDGVINHDSDAFIKSPDEWVPIPGSLQAIARLNQAGYRVVVATNQSGIGRKLFDMATLNAIHQKMHAAAQQVGATIDAVFFARIWPMKIAIAANLNPVCCRKSHAAMKSI